MRQLVALVAFSRRAGCAVRALALPYLVGMVLGADLLMSGGAAHAQGPPGQSNLALIAEQGLAFGVLIPGEPRRVLTHEAELRAEFRAEGRGNGRMLFVLPSQLVNLRSLATIPVSFGAGDGRIDPDRSPAYAFDPNDGVEIRHGRPVAESVIYLGGTALPAPDQAAGDYEATITTILVEIDT